MSAARQPDVTRQRLLECAFDEIHKRGFRSASLDAILDKAGVTKGALYHHFDNKNALGYAVLDELVRPYMQAQWEPLRTADDPVSAAVAGLRKRREKLRERLLAYGCPFNNLAQEMSPHDEGFRSRLQGILSEWIGAYAEALARGQALGKVRADLNVPAAAVFIVSAIEGLIGMAKTAQSGVLYDEGLRGLIEYLERLRPAD
ncbi:TetR/AcrR family transcriptional regulator [Stagnimonas aquatica]|uniref:TetR/AcrR family transcriptional regulator n=1 Tax=Stagnimonas aquatica TaxID=2689987 RepID=A0A3N0VKV0_9GAMM|nr:TetR/AcrR family transcriptional regulator [Stagnimonas aquatica]ROH93344.1 TetR/AcrR family transcriptional regulator [Stagnimonas aquatica]